MKDEKLSLKVAREFGNVTDIAWDRTINCNILLFSMDMRRRTEMTQTGLHGGPPIIHWLNPSPHSNLYLCISKFPSSNPL